MKDRVHAGCPSTTIDNASIVIVSTSLDEDRRMTVLEMIWVSGIPKTSDVKIRKFFLSITFGTFWFLSIIITSYRY